jgi:hypothetical protein
MIYTPYRPRDLGEFQPVLMQRQLKRPDAITTSHEDDRYRNGRNVDALDNTQEKLPPRTPFDDQMMYWSKVSNDNECLPTQLGISILAPSGDQLRPFLLKQKSSSVNLLWEFGTTRQSPVGPDEMAGVAVRISFEVILMLGFGLPELARRRDFRHYLAGPQA